MTITLHAETLEQLAYMEHLLVKAGDQYYNLPTIKKIAGSTYEIPADYPVKLFNAKLNRWHEWNNNEELWFKRG